MNLLAQETDAMDLMMEQLVGAAVFAALGCVIFAIAFFVMSKLTPFSLRKEIEEDQNTALGVVMGCVILGISIIIAAAIAG